MIAKLERLIGEIGDLNSKLILLVGPSRSGKTQLLRQLGDKLSIEPLNVGLELGRRLGATPNNKRGFSAGELLREIADKERTEDPLLLDNLELLFEPSLQINPFDLVRRLAHSKRVVAVWPGELRGDRLVYADMSQHCKVALPPCQTSSESDSIPLWSSAARAEMPSSCVL